MGGAQCKDIGVMCGCVSEEPSFEVRTEVPVYSGGGAFSPPVDQYAAQISLPVPTAGQDSSAAPRGGPPTVTAATINSSANQNSANTASEAPPPPAASANSSGGAGGGDNKVIFDKILSDLEGSEMKVYGDVFNSFSRYGSGEPVSLEDQACREFLQMNGSFDDLDMAMLQAANSETMTLDLDGIVQLLRNNSLADGEILGQFQMLSSDGMSLSSEECRTGLILMAQEKLNERCFADDQWDCILTMVMMDAGPSVSMEDWMRYAKKVGRYVRLVQYCSSYPGCL